MAQLIDIQKVAIGPESMTAQVRVAEGGPLTTDEDLVGTTLVYRLLPEICDHACLGDAGSTFKDALPKTELAHLLEHVTIELMARTNRADDISCGRTWAAGDDDRTFDVQVACPDDVLATLAMSSAAWILQWAYSGGGEPAPDIDAIVGGICAKLDEVADQEDGAGPAGPTDPVEARDPAPAGEEPEEVEEEPADDAPVAESADEGFEPEAESADDGFEPEAEAEFEEEPEASEPAEAEVTEAEAAEEDEPEDAPSVSAPPSLGVDDGDLDL